MKLSREPALIIGFITSVVAALVALNLDLLSPGQGAALVAVVGAIITAVTTRPVMPSLYAGAFAAAAALFAEYGLHLSEGLVAAVGGAIIGGFALFGVRGQVTPANDTAPTAPREGPIR